MYYSFDKEKNVFFNCFFKTTITLTYVLKEQTPQQLWQMISYGAWENSNWGYFHIK